MARIAKLRVVIKPGTFSSERSVRFQFEGKNYNLIVDEGDVNEAGETLNVHVIAENRQEGRALVELPRETFTSGNRIVVSTCDLEYSDSELLQPA